MSYVILDLEWNGSYSKVLHKFVNEIIEFGAVKTDDEFNITDEFSVLISPQIGKKLCSKVKELTKITNEELRDNGVSFLDAVKMFSEFSDDSVLVTWSTSDIHALVENYSYYTNDINLPFLTKYCNLQEYCESCLDLHDASSQLGLSACAEKLGVEFSEEEHHRAFADAKLSLKCLEKLICDYPIDDFIQNADCSSFYDRMMFKNYYITDLQSPDIDKSQMYFYCTECGCLINRTAKWRIHNKAFTADFICKNCEKKYHGRISFKKKYDGVIIKKKLTEKIPKESKVKEKQFQSK